MKYILVLLVLVFCLPTLANHDLSEALKMFNQGTVQKQVLLVKYKDSITVRNINKTLATNIPYLSENVFIRGEKVYQQERLALSSRLKLTHLENYIYFHLKNIPSAQEARNILKNIYAQSIVEFAYFEPTLEVAVINESLGPIRSIESNIPTPNFEAGQFYLKPAPLGIDAYYAWTLKGGTGTGIKVVDVEFGWTHKHEEFKAPFWTNQISGSHATHGTAVLGVLAAKKINQTGIVGISHDVEFGTAGMKWQGSWDKWFVSFARAFDQATVTMSPGHVMVIELQGNGPDSKYVPMEYWKPMFDTIKLATAKGIHVIEAAGNGDANLDAPIYQNIFSMSVRDSGAIMVGAGAPPTPDQQHLTRMSFSNYGARIDAMGYGWDVVTTGYGDLFGGSNSARQYTKKFSGTSSATPIVAGAVASLSGMAKMQNVVITPEQMRTALRKTGTPQLGNTHQRIGNLPNMKELVKYFSPAN
ncbi:MAG: S8 family peptidase [Oligoflexia bacterium]|nr:S8 family peptidase [Oligoflexia bacterium]